MANSVLKIGGVDYTKFIASEGIEIQRADFDGENSGMTLGLVGIREFLGTLYKLSITFERMSSLELQALIKAMNEPTFTADFLDPETNGLRTAKFQKTSISNAILKIENGTPFYSNIKFNLSETK